MQREPKPQLLAEPNVSETEALCSDGALTVKQAAVFSGLSRSTLYGCISDGRLAALRIGGRRLIPKRALVQMLALGLNGEDT